MAGALLDGYKVRGETLADPRLNPSHFPEGFAKENAVGVRELGRHDEVVLRFAPRELLLVLKVEDYGRSDKRVAALAEGIARPNSGSTLVLVETASET